MYTEKWIWLPEKQYPAYQMSHYSVQSAVHSGQYAVAEFKREYAFDCPVAEMKLRVSGDTEFRLYMNEQILATGPVSVGGDFLFNDEPRSRHYASEWTVYPGEARLAFFAQVKLTPIGLSEYSRGHGGFMLSARLRLTDGRIKYIYTDSSWLCRLNRAFMAPGKYDQVLDTDAYTNAAEIPNIWHCDTAPLPLRTETVIYPQDHVLSLAPGEERTALLHFDMIHAGFAAVDVRTEGSVEIAVDLMETQPVCAHYDLKFCKSGTFRAFQLRSAGVYRVHVKNASGTCSQAAFSLIATHYPAENCARTIVSDPDLNRVLDVCRHTLKYCRQTIHLDSPKHAEPLACTGDYYIESLMTAMSFGDMRLAEFDVLRTAELLRVHDGRMFHTTYSLIWVLMLWDVYMMTGHRNLLEQCQEALVLLLDRFETYVGENGLIETPPDFMFVDWIYIDGLSMHHPPKALGQTCLCAYYYAALKAAHKVFCALDCEGQAARCTQKADDMRHAVNRLLFDQELGLYFDGLNTPTPDELLYQYMPQNVEKRYYMPHSNILCACFGLCDDETGRRILRKAVDDPAWGACQPYFKHFLLEAVFRLGMQKEDTLTVLEAWKAPVHACDKGLVEGFIAPEPTYSFDHSHAWGGTPLYALPKHLLGLELLEPGYRKIRLCPSLLGLDYASVEVPTPMGVLSVRMEKGKDAVLNVPDGIEVVYG